jgi:polysaccharide biosynthesis protein PslL
MTAPRNPTLDIAKGLGIILVVLGHNWVVESTKGELFRVIFSFHVPLFFFLSGVFLRKTDALTAFVRARTHSLLKPYFVILLAIGAAKMAGWAYFEGVLYATGRTLYWIPMWYLPHLFLCALVARLLIRAIDSTRLLWAIAAASLLLGVLALTPADWPWSIDLLPITSAFVLGGYLCRHALATMRFHALAFTAALAAFAALHYFFDLAMDLNIRRYGPLLMPFLIVTAQAALGIYLCLGVACVLARVKPVMQVLAYVGSGTLFILIFHIFFQWKAFNVLTPVIGEPAAAVGGLLAGVALPLGLWEIAKRNRWLTALLLPPRR